MIIDDDNFWVCANQADEIAVIEPVRGASSPNSATSTGWAAAACSWASSPSTASRETEGVPDYE